MIENGARADPRAPDKCATLGDALDGLRQYREGPAFIPTRTNRNGRMEEIEWPGRALDRPVGLRRAPRLSRRRLKVGYGVKCRLPPVRIRTVDPLGVHHSSFSTVIGRSRTLFPVA